MKRITVLTLMTLVTLSFTSCGKKGGYSTITDDNIGYQLQTIPLEAQCNDSNDMSHYTALQSGDILSKEDNNTLIKIFHAQDNKKVSCVVSGKASIIRVDN